MTVGLVRSHVRRRPTPRFRFLIEPPRITTFGQLRDDVIGYGVTLIFGETLLQPAHILRARRRANATAYLSTSPRVILIPMRTHSELWFKYLATGHAHENTP